MNSPSRSQSVQINSLWDFLASCWIFLATFCIPSAISVSIGVVNSCSCTLCHGPSLVNLMSVRCPITDVTVT